MKVLLITSRNVYGTSGELRLIKNRTETLLLCYNVETDILLFKRDKVLKTKQEVFEYASFNGVYYNCLNHTYKFKKYLSLVDEKIQVEKYDAIIISGLFMFFNMAKHIKRQSPEIKVILDIHGTLEELQEFPGKNLIQSVIRKFFYVTSVRNQKKSIPNADGYFVVSKALQKHIMKKVSGLKDKSFFIVPCGIKETEINKEESIKNRTFYRAKYGIADDELLFIYSGGVSPWQCIDESVSLFKNYSVESGHKCRMLILSGNLDYVNRYKSNNIITDSYSGDEVRKVLCAGDYAFLLRGDFMTNHVAYPNKFLEYVASGMKIIATNNVDDVAAQVRDYSVGMIVDFNDSLKEKIEQVAEVEYLADIEKRNALLTATCFSTTLKPFVNYLEA